MPGTRPGMTVEKFARQLSTRHPEVRAASAASLVCRRANTRFGALKTRRSSQRERRRGGCTARVPQRRAATAKPSPFEAPPAFAGVAPQGDGKWSLCVGLGKLGNW
jgi:hypothetical protein